MSRSRLLPRAGSCHGAAPAPAAGETGQGGSDPRLSGCQQPGGADRAPGSLFVPLLLRNRRFHSNREHHMVTLALQRASPQGASLRPALPAPRRPGATGNTVVWVPREAGTAWCSWLGTPRELPELPSAVWVHPARRSEHSPRWSVVGSVLTPFSGMFLGCPGCEGAELCCPTEPKPRP